MSLTMKSDIDKELSILQSQWLDLQKQQLINRASDLYLEKILPFLLEKFKQTYPEQINQCQYLISLIGMSPEPIILTIKTLQPREILFLYTEDTKKYLDFIGEYLKLRPSDFQKACISGSKTEEVYQEIKKFLDGKNPTDCFVDISGGKKSMVGGAAEAAGILGARVVYVDNRKFNEELRRPMPGSEYLNFLENPYLVFGEIDIQEALKLYQAGSYNEALQILLRLKKKIAEIQKLDILIAIVSLHNLWEEHQFEKALSQAQNSLHLIAQYRVGQEFKTAVEKKRDLLNILLDESQNPVYLVFHQYFLAKRYYERKKFDFAVLMLYRTIEMIFSVQLYRKYHIDTNNANIDEDYPLLLAQYNNLLEEAYQRRAVRLNKFPQKLGFMNSVIILRAFKDPLLEGYDLKEIRERSDLRNKSFLAHGFKPNTSADYETMEKFFKSMVQRFKAIYLPQIDDSELEQWYLPIPLHKI